MIRVEVESNADAVGVIKAFGASSELRESDYEIVQVIGFDPGGVTAIRRAISEHGGTGRPSFDPATAASHPGDVGGNSGGASAFRVSSVGGDIYVSGGGAGDGGMGCGPATRGPGAPASGTAGGNFVVQHPAHGAAERGPTSCPGYSEPDY